MEMELNLEEFNKLEYILKLNRMPYERTDIMHPNLVQHTIYFPNKKRWLSYATICNPYSIGIEDGLLEQKGLLPKKLYGKEKDVEGYLDAKTIFKRWSAKYYSDLLKFGIIDREWLWDL